jgi:hypothetical protein
MIFDRTKFFKLYRSKFGALNQISVDGLEFLIDRFEKDNWTDIRLISYVLSTCKHETADTYQPIREYRARAGTKMRIVQDKYWLSGYFGRGYVMLTWLKNYELLSNKVGGDLVKAPDLALSPNIAFEILVVGMLQGLFTGKKLSDFINSSECDYVNARRTVNGTDKALLVAGYAENFESILKKSVSTETRAAAASADAEQIGSAQQPVEAAENSIVASPPVDNSADTSNTSQRADTIVNTGAESGEARKIEAAGDAPPVSVPTPPATGFLGKLGATIGGLFTGSIVLPSFVEKVFSGEVSQGLIDLIKFVFPYLFFGAIGGLIIWFIAKKLNNFALTHLFVTTNTDTTKKDIVFTPPLETTDTKTLNL